jgi:methyl-accepting chemotaxis protein
MRPPNKRWPRPLPDWSVTTKLFVVLALVVTLTVAFFGALDYRNEKNILEVFHQFLMQRDPAGFGIGQLQEHQHHLALIRAALTRSGATHLIHWGATVVVLVVALHWAVKRIVVSPAREIMAGLNVIELGTWNLGLAVRSADEMGELTRKLNEVGKVVSRRVNEWRGVERLSALALVSNSVSGEVEQVSKAIRAAAQTLRAADASNRATDYSKVIKGLEAQAVRLEALETALDEKFSRTLEGVRAGQRDEECE